jgi:hypothetical protein
MRIRAGAAVLGATESDMDPHETAAVRGVTRHGNDRRGITRGYLGALWIGGEPYPILAVVA